jgi:hypothetical protein
MRIQRRERVAFTLVEMLVAVALTLFIMAIIAEAFGSATKTFSTMRTAGQLQERTRGGAIVLRLDLAAEHFDGPYIGGRGGPRVGDQRLDLAGWMPPGKGYFEIRQFPNGLFPNQTGISEPMMGPLTDGEGLPSTRADTHVLRFTVKLPELPAAELYSAELPPTVTCIDPTTGNPIVLPFGNNGTINSFPTGQPIVYSRWAEIQYFLRLNGEMTPATNNGPSLPLYSLRRRVRLLATDRGVTYPPMPAAQAALLMAQYPDVAMARTGVGPNNTVILRVLGAEDVSNPGRTNAPVPINDPIRMDYGAYSQKLNPATATMYETGDDILITDVLSFEVKAAWFNNQSNPSFNSILNGSSPAVRPLYTLVNNAPVTINPEEPFDDIPMLNATPAVPPNSPPLNPDLAGQRRFDTWYLDPGSPSSPLSPSSDNIDWDKALSTSGGQKGFLEPFKFQPPLRINVRAVQIKIRVWDAKKETARQMTVIQEI